MPELPEAETIVRGLRTRVVGTTVTGVEVLHEDVLAPGLTPERLGATLRGRRIEGVARRGKNVVFLFNPGIRLLINLGMSGRVVTRSAPLSAELRHHAVRFQLDDGDTIIYDDIRRFGRVELFTATTWPEFSSRLGVEPLSTDFTADRLYEMTRRSRTPIRNWLLDQRWVAGVGNIYANEALFRAGIRPDRPANSLDPEEARRLRDKVAAVLEEAVEARGTTFSDYRDFTGATGEFQLRLRVYGRQGEPCPTCATPIERVVLSNRSAFYCPKCQR